MAEIKLIAAIDDKRGLARKDGIPWDLPTDKQYFRDHTKGQVVILGNRTYLEMKPMLGDRKAYVVAREDEIVEDAEVINDLPAFLREVEEDVWVIGGGQIFTLALPFATKLFLTRVKGDFGCEVFFPEFENTFRLESESEMQTENGTNFKFQIWV